MDQVKKNIINKMQGFSTDIVDFVLKQIEKIQRGETGLINWNEISPLLQEDLVYLSDLMVKKNQIEKLAVCKLNGGLGTSMGLLKPKSMIQVRENFSFLEIILRQIKNLSLKSQQEIPFILMNSYATEEKTKQFLEKMNFQYSHLFSFLQNKVPRLKKESLFPLDSTIEEENWSPPGHGDFWLCLQKSNLLDELIKNGIEYMFVSNIDNIGATVDFKILNFLIENQIDFALEMTPKLLSDKKGGVVYRSKEFLKLLEIAQVPQKHKDDFMNSKIFPFFSTNNLWFNLKAFKEISWKNFDLSLIVNEKLVNQESIIQIETAIGSAISNFKKSKIIIVDRDRFLPVKLCEDLLVKRSDFYFLENNFHLKKVNEQSQEPLIQLEQQYYKDLLKFQKYFLKIPSLKNCQSLTVKGEVIFDKEIIISGQVTIQNTTQKPVSISSVKKNKLHNETISF